MLPAAGPARPAPHRQRQFLRLRAATRTGPAGRDPPVDLRQALAGPFGLALQPARQAAPRRVRDVSGKLPVPEHVPHFRRLHAGRLVPVGQPLRQPVPEVAARVRRSFVRLGDKRAPCRGWPIPSSCATGPSACAAGSPPRASRNAGRRPSRRSFRPQGRQSPGQPPSPRPHRRPSRARARAARRRPGSRHGISPSGCGTPRRA